ncbi:MAG: hypothetical protein ACM3SW_09300 [Actinomycetota bacterium]
MRSASYLLLLCFLVTIPLYAQSPCAVNLPVGLIAPDGSLLNGLTTKDITVELHKKKLQIHQISYDTGTRRVLLILDTSQRLPAEVRKTEVALARHILSRSRPSDTFALLTARGAARQVRFAQGNNAVIKAVEELAADPKEDKKAGSLLDALMEGAGWFGTPQTGDAILVMSDYLQHDTEGEGFQSGFATNTGPYYEDSRYNFRTVAETIARDRIRVFSVQFGAMSVDPATYEPSDENLLGLSLGSGGSLLESPMRWYGGYKVTPAALEGLEHQVYQLYGSIAQFYLLNVDAPMPLHRQQWKLELARDLRKNTRALYPRWFDPCGTEENARAGQ